MQWTEEDNLNAQREGWAMQNLGTEKAPNWQVFSAGKVPTQATNGSVMAMLYNRKDSLHIKALTMHFLGRPNHVVIKMMVEYHNFVTIYAAHNLITYPQMVDDLYDSYLETCKALFSNPISKDILLIAEFMEFPNSNFLLL